MGCMELNVAKKQFTLEGGTLFLVSIYIVQFSSVLV